MQENKDRSGNDSCIFCIFVSTLLTRPVSLDDKLHVRAEPWLHLPKPSQCHMQQEF